MPVLCSLFTWGLMYSFGIHVLENFVHECAQICVMQVLLAGKAIIIHSAVDWIHPFCSRVTFRGGRRTTSATLVASRQCMHVSQPVGVVTVL